MRVSYRRQVPIPGVPYSAEEVVLEAEVEAGQVREWLLQAKMAVTGAAVQPVEPVRSAGEAPNPEGKPTGAQRQRIRDLHLRAARAGVKVDDLEGPTTFAEAEVLLDVLKQRIAARSRPPSP